MWFGARGVIGSLQDQGVGVGSRFLDHPVSWRFWSATLHAIVFDIASLFCFRCALGFCARRAGDRICGCLGRPQRRGTGSAQVHDLGRLALGAEVQRDARGSWRTRHATSSSNRRLRLPCPRAGRPATRSYVKDPLQMLRSALGLDDFCWPPARTCVGHHRGHQLGR